jgi:pimeloyl-ACP methyl ester carboxylesterase
MTSPAARHVTSITGPLTLPFGGFAAWVESADGTRIHTLTFGPAHAPTVVLAHGFALHSRAWAYQVRDLCHDYRVVVYDARGHGRSDLPATSQSPSQYALDALGHDLQAVLESRVLQGTRAVIAGHSMGGIALMSWARLYPAEVTRLAAAAVLINTTAHARLGATMRGVLRWLVHSRLRFPLRAVFGESVQREHMDALIEMLAMAPPPLLTELARSLGQVDLDDALPKLVLPTWIIAGGKDRAIPPIQAERMARALPDLQGRIVLPRCGHMAPWEERSLVSRVIAEAVAGTVSGTAMTPISTETRPA